MGVKRERFQGPMPEEMGAGMEVGRWWQALSVIERFDEDPAGFVANINTELLKNEPNECGRNIRCEDVPREHVFS
ncbi:MAG TPA: hypothetical protein PK177_00125 [Burkholderiaceae bacterium]|nr:hypothetical protein [Burkholderiaceae bacterium]